MSKLWSILQSLGNAGAVANAAHLGTARRRDEFVVTAMERRLEAAATGARGRPAA